MKVCRTLGLAKRSKSKLFLVVAATDRHKGREMIRLTGKPRDESTHRYAYLLTDSVSIAVAPV